jgi:hypothetical protein
VSQNSLRIEAPDDVFIDQVLAGDGPVKPKKPLLVLRSPRLDRLIARVAAFQQHIEIAERPFHDGRVDEEVQALVQKSEFLQRALEWSEEALQVANDKFRAGEIFQVDVDKAQVDVLRAGSAHIDAKIASDHAPKKHRDMIDKLNATKESLRQHQAFLQVMKSAMTISSPVKGQFKALVAPGWFVRRGHVLGEITI